MAGLDNPYYLDVNPKKVEEIRELLESRDPMRKFEAMKRTFGLISKGLNVSELFPSVVKSIITPSLDVKRLVFQYIVHYAEVNPDLCLLCVDKLHKDIVENPNALVRALSLRVLSSIRSRDIVHVVARDVQKASTDSSPFVRKAAALAIPKIVSLEPDQKDSMIECIVSLLRDNTTLVLGPALFAFSEICPDRWDLLHPHFRKLCHLLVDLDEWSQTITLRVLLHYTRSQFVNPMSCPPPDAPRDAAAEAASSNASGPAGGEPKKEKKGFYDDVDAFFGKPAPFLRLIGMPRLGAAAPAGADGDKTKKEDLYSAAEMDPDHRLLLRSVQPLLLGRNPAVVLGVAALYFYAAPEADFTQAVRALIRLTYESPEVAAVALQSIAVMAAARPVPFAPFVKDFFVRVTDSAAAKLLRLDILTRIVNDTNVRSILREFESHPSHLCSVFRGGRGCVCVQAYVYMADKAFVSATIRAIGRCAVVCPEMTESCLQGLLGLITARDENVVGEAVVAIKNLLQQSPRDQDNSRIIRHMAHILPDTRIPLARASIVWVMGEYCASLRDIGPDSLRVLVKGFCEEATEVKMQILNLAVKLYLDQPDKTGLLLQHALNLARYDMAFDLRDRARFFRALIFDGATPALSGMAPVDANSSTTRYTLGSLTHIVGRPVAGYEPLPAFPLVAPDPSVRIPAASMAAMSQPAPWEQQGGGGNKYAGLDKNSAIPASNAPAPDPTKFYGDEASGSESDSESGSGSGSGSESGSGSGSGSESEDEAARRPAKGKKGAEGDLLNLAALSLPAQEEGAQPLFGAAFRTAAPAPAPAAAAPSAAGQAVAAGGPRLVLCNQRKCGGVQIEYIFTRKPSMFGTRMTALRLFFTNAGTSPVKSLSMRPLPGEHGQSVHAFSEMAFIPPGATAEAPLNVDFADRTSPVKFEIVVERTTERGPERAVYPVTLAAPYGELLRPVAMAESVFQAQADKMQGLMECQASFAGTPGGLQGEPLAQWIHQAVLGCAHLQPLLPAADGTLRWAGESVSQGAATLVRVQPARRTVLVSSDNLVANSELAEAIAERIQKGPQPQTA
ncbi:Adaptor protein complex 3 (AP-3); beta subunit [Paratrimastix pyriformis]|uniref:AP-3 complex subunit beta n=1 Tax=Paratrimastix pyriformis TaxID=342808 RepID=A0ABQ8URH9_9EUKA|nr:Adaptor protein complex 3 (AP-3); beta subunit [Paratrimastix pyriformis]